MAQVVLLFTLVVLVASESLLLKTEEGLMVQIDPWGRDSLRVRIGPTISDDLPGALIPPQEYQKNIFMKESPQGAIVNGNLQAEVGVNGLLTFTRLSDNKVILQEIARNVTLLNSTLGNYFLNSVYASDPNERIYALGEHKTGVLNNKGQSYTFEDCINYSDSQGGQVCIPYLVSSYGYGFLWNLPSFGGVNLGMQNTSWTSVFAYQMDIWVTTITGTSALPMADITSNYADATGHAPALPYFASGFWQCKNRYRNQTEVLAVAEGYVSRGLPISVIVIDWYHWIALGDWFFNPACWPDPAGMVKSLQSMGIELMVSVWPLVDSNSVNYQNMSNSNYLVQCPSTHNICHGSSDYLYDPTIPAAREYVWEQVQKGYFDYGIKVWWLDADEPEQFDGHPQLIYSIGPQEMVGMIYPFYHQQTFYNGMKSQNQTEIIMLSRSAWAGSQRWGAAVWSGDIQPTFESLAQQVRAGLNMGLSGIVWWTTDIGGYNGGNITDPQWQELVVRWFQYGAFCPLFRLHGDRVPDDPYSNTCGGSGGPNEIWEFGAAAYQAIPIVMKIREGLRPYIMNQMALASNNGTPVMRPLWFDFPNDVNVTTIEDQFMFGPQYMVAPVLEYQARSRSVYFPAGSDWVHWFTNIRYTGGTLQSNFSAPLDSFPLFTRV